MDLNPRATTSKDKRLTVYSWDFFFCFQIDFLRGSNPGRVIPKTQKIILDTALLNTQHYKVRIKGKMEQFGEWSSALPYTLVL